MCDKPRLFATDTSKRPQSLITISPDNTRKRRSITVKEKLDMLSMIDNGHKLSAVAREFGISSSTASTIVKERHKIKLLSDHYNIDPDRKRMRLGIYRDVDEAVHLWFRQMRMKNIPVNGPMLQQKAREFASQLGHQNFEGSSGWLFRFRERHGLTVKTMRVNDDSNVYNCAGVGMTDDEIVTSVSQNSVHSLTFCDRDKNATHEIPEDYLVPEIELVDSYPIVEHSDSGPSAEQNEHKYFMNLNDSGSNLNDNGVISIQEAISLTRKLTSFLKQHDVPTGILKSMNAVSGFIEFDLREQLKQRKITDFFKPH